MPSRITRTRKQARDTLMFFFSEARRRGEVSPDVRVSFTEKVRRTNPTFYLVMTWLVLRGTDMSLDRPSKKLLFRVNGPVPKRIRKTIKPRGTCSYKPIATKMWDGANAAGEERDLDPDYYDQAFVEACREEIDNPRYLERPFMPGTPTEQPACPGPKIQV